jgi:hypothetical protein
MYLACRAMPLSGIVRNYKKTCWGSAGIQVPGYEATCIVRRSATRRIAECSDALDA